MVSGLRDVLLIQDSEFKHGATFFFLTLNFQAQVFCGLSFFKEPRSWKKYASEKNFFIFYTLIIT